MKTIIENINEILKESGMIMISRHDGLFKLENIKDQPEKKTFFQWFEKKFFGLLEECQNEYERFEKMKNLKYSYECPECGKINRFESEVTIIRCDKCDHVFNSRLEDIIVDTMDLAKCDDWKILDVNDLSDCPDILNGDYQFQSLELKTDWPVCWNEVKEYKILTILKNIEDGFFKYRYKHIPTKKTHEELAEEYADSQIRKLRPDFEYGLKQIRHHSYHAFIAGRKSMEVEK